MNLKSFCVLLLLLVPNTELSQNTDDKIYVSNKSELAWIVGYVVLKSSGVRESEIPENRQNLIRQIEGMTLVGAGSVVVNDEFPHFFQLNCLVDNVEWAVDFSTRESIAFDKEYSVKVDAFNKAEIGGVEIWRRLPDGSIDVVFQKIPQDKDPNTGKKQTKLKGTKEQETADRPNKKNVD